VGLDQRRPLQRPGLAQGDLEYKGYADGDRVRLTHKYLHRGPYGAKPQDMDFDPGEREDLARLAGQLFAAFRAALKL
jgi:hypothetical protein